MISYSENYRKGDHFNWINWNTYVTIYIMSISEIHVYIYTCFVDTGQLRVFREDFFIQKFIDTNYLYNLS